MKLRPETVAMTAVLALLTGLGPLSMDMYLASFPDMVRVLATPASQVQLTISFYLIGFAVGQVAYGPLSDRHGRRPVLIVALTTYLVATLVCIVAPNIEILIGARFVQAVGAAGSIVLARAMVRDLYDGARVGRELSRLATIIAIAPVSAPLVGGVLQTAFGWRSNFVMLFIVGAVALSCVIFVLPETIRRRSPEQVSVLSIVRSYRLFLHERAFLAYLGLGTCCFVGLFAWISAATFVLQDVYGLSALMFGIGFGVCSAGYMLGAAIAARFVVRWGINKMMGLGCAAMAAGGLVMIGVVLFQLPWAAALYGSMAIYLAGMGMVLPQTQAGALLPFPDRAGAASSLLGLVQQTAAAITGALLGHSIGMTAWPLALTVVAAGIAGCVIWLLSRGVRARALEVRR